MQVKADGKLFKTDIYFDKSGVQSRFKRNTSYEQKYLDSQVIKDSAKYVPRLTGALERSGISGTKIGSGLILYNMYYAKTQYYGFYRHTLAFHPMATRTWFEVAKASYKQSWIRAVKKLAARR